MLDQLNTEILHAAYLINVCSSASVEGQFSRGCEVRLSQAPVELAYNRNMKLKLEGRGEFIGTVVRHECRPTTTA